MPDKVKRPKASLLMKQFSALGILDEEIFTTKRFLSDRAVRLGAVMSFSICNGQVDFYVDAEGLLVGTANQSRKSWKKYRGPKEVKFRYI